MTPEARLIRVDVDHAYIGPANPKYWWVSSSPDMHALAVEGDTGDEVLSKLPGAITKVYEALGQSVHCYRAAMASGGEAGSVLKCSAVFVVVPA